MQSISHNPGSNEGHHETHRGLRVTALGSRQHDVTSRATNKPTDVYLSIHRTKYVAEEKQTAVRSTITMNYQQN